MEESPPCGNFLSEFGKRALREWTCSTETVFVAGGDILNIYQSLERVTESNLKWSDAPLADLLVHAALCFRNQKLVEHLEEDTQIFDNSAHAFDYYKMARNSRAVEALVSRRRVYQRSKNTPHSSKRSTPTRT